MSNVKCIKLVSGEDIIADYSANEGTATLENPVQVSVVPTRTGEPNFGFIPFPVTSNEKKLQIDVRHIIFTCEPAEEFHSQYNAIFGSGIVTPKKKIIV